MTEKILMVAAILALGTAGRARAQQPTDAGSLYARTCASCHGAKGTPSPGMARGMGIPDLAAASMAAVTDSALSDAVLNGKGRTMPAYKSRLTSAQIAALVAYIRTFSRRQ